MTKQELISLVQTKCEGTVTKAMIDDVLAATAAAVAEAVSHDDKVTVPGICSISVKERAARTGRNPQTGEPITLPAGKRVAITPVAALKASVK